MGKPWYGPFYIFTKNWNVNGPFSLNLIIVFSVVNGTFFSVLNGAIDYGPTPCQRTYKPQFIICDRFLYRANLRVIVLSKAALQWPLKCCKQFSILYTSLCITISWLWYVLANKLSVYTGRGLLCSSVIDLQGNLLLCTCCAGQLWVCALTMTQCDKMAFYALSYYRGLSL